MKKYLKFFFYFLYWLLFFVAAKAIFLIYHSTLTQSLSGDEIFKIFLYGLRMDASFTGYICILPFLLFIIRTLYFKIKIEKVILIYTYTLVVLFSFLTIADLELYTAWGFRMDSTPLQYFKSLREMGSTISSAPVLTLMIIFVAFAALFIFIYKKYFDFFIDDKPVKFSVNQLLFSLILLAILFVPIRGGFQKIPINISDVYFSQKLFADHAAINLPWNIMFSLLNRNNPKNPFDYFSEQKAEELVHELYHTSPVQIPSIISTQKPNIIIIILESFTAKLVGCLGGVPGVTPNLDKIAADGLLFTNIYAAGDRSEKGQIAILSGYPNQAIHSIIKIPNKTRGLPSLNKVLKKAGYSSSFTYGGELEFANIKSYLVNIGFDKLTDKYSFPASQRTTSWGVHDEFVLDHFYKDLKTKKEPFFATLFTLSSHEPYDVPVKPHFQGKDETTLFKNSVYYTDSVIGDFITKSKMEKWWKNTLVIFVADHGHPIPGYDPNDRPSKFHIPLIFSGGALKIKGKINSIGSQTDIAATILDQLNIPGNNFEWSKDLLDSSARQFAFYSFNNGFGFVTPKGAVTIDNVSKQIIYIDKSFDSSNIKFGKAYMQYSYQDYLNR